MSSISDGGPSNDGFSGVSRNSLSQVYTSWAVSSLSPKSLKMASSRLTSELIRIMINSLNYLISIYSLEMMSHKK